VCRIDQRRLQFAATAVVGAVEQVLHHQPLSDQAFDALAGRAVGDQQALCRILDHVADGGGRVGRVDRQVGGTGPHHAQLRGDGGAAARHAHADRRLRPGAELQQAAVQRCACATSSP